MAYLYPKIGERVLVIAPHSEVMMHFGLAGKPVEVALVYDGLPSVAGNRLMAQVYVAGNRFSFPILPGEAGFYFDSASDAYYVDMTQDEEAPRG